jgi:flagellar M-ring protein FliF
MNALDILKKFWQARNSQQKTNILIVTAIFVATCVLIFTWASRPDFKPLYTNLSPKDAGAIAKKLLEEKIPYKLEDQGNTILVPQRYLYETRLKLASSGLPESGNIGFEIFDKMNLQTSEFIENVNYVRALQGELANTIQGIQEVKSARVMLNLPKESIYMEEQAPASASIVVSMSGKRTLSLEQVQAIAYLVSSSVKNLKPENITIVDDKGALLYSPELASGGFSSSSQFQLQKNFQKEMEIKVQGMLDKIFGAGKSLARVTVDMEFDKQTIDKELFEPVEKDEGIVRSIQENVEAYSEGGSKGAVRPLPTPSPGTGASSPSPAASRPLMASGKPSYDQRNVIKNFEVNRSKEHRVVAPGKIKRITAGVFLDKSIALDDKSLKSVNEVLESSIGIDRKRGDIIRIHSLAFNNDYWNEQKKLMEEQDKKGNIISMIKLASPALAVIIFILFYLIMLKRLPRAKVYSAIQGPQAAPMHPRDTGAAAIGKLSGPALDNISLSRPDESVALRDGGGESDIIRKIASENPNKIAGMIESLMREGE